MERRAEWQSGFTSGGVSSIRVVTYVYFRLFVLLMHIAIMVPRFTIGGFERVLTLLARGMSELGHRVDIVTLNASGPLLAEFGTKVNVVELGTDRMLYALPAMLSYIRANQPDVMISGLRYGNVAALLCKGLMLFEKHRPRFIATIHNNMTLVYEQAVSIKERLLIRTLDNGLRWFDRVVCVSEGVKEDVEIRASGHLPEVSVIYNPVIYPEIDSMATHNVELPWDRSKVKIILSVGRFVKQKDFLTLVRAFRLLLDRCPDARLILVGDGPCREEIVAQIQENGLCDYVYLPGYDANPYKYMNCADMFVMSSKWEGMGITLVEALYFRLKIVATDCKSGPREVLKDGEYGKLANVGDTEGLSTSMYEVLKNETSTPCPSETLNTYSYLNVAKRYEAIL